MFAYISRSSRTCAADPAAWSNTKRVDRCIAIFSSRYGDLYTRPTCIVLSWPAHRCIGRESLDGSYSNAGCERPCQIELTPYVFVVVPSENSRSRIECILQAHREYRNAKTIYRAGYIRATPVYIRKKTRATHAKSASNDSMRVMLDMTKLPSSTCTISSPARCMSLLR